jgi:3-dehydrosphinganine reductase
MPAGIDSPGYVEEQRSKPAITRTIEEGDKVISPGECAGHLIRGEC